MSAMATVPMGRILSGSFVCQNQNDIFTIPICQLQLNVLMQAYRTYLTLSLKAASINLLVSKEVNTFMISLDSFCDNSRRYLAV